MKFGLVGKHYVSESPIAANCQLINWYPEVVEDERGRNTVILLPTPGLDEFISGSTPTGPHRGCIDVNGRAFAVIRNVFYEIASTGAQTNRGAIAGITGTVSMTASDDEILILVPGSTAYVFTLTTNVLATVTDADFPASTSLIVDYVDGYFFVLSSNGNLYYSALNNASSWDALDFVVVQAPSNTPVSMRVINQEPWFFGDRVTQPYYNSGNSDDPWQPVRSGLINQGCMARFSVAPVPDYNSVIWLGHNDSGRGIFLMAEGYNAVRISDHSVEHAIHDYSTLSDCISFVFQCSGHTFYQASFPTANRTWRYDVTASKQLGYPVWHQALYWNNSTGEYEAHRALYQMEIFNRHLVGDRANGKLYEINSASVSGGTASFSDDDGDVIRRLRSCPLPFQENKRIIFPGLELLFEAGLATSTGQGADPQIMLRFSGNGGKTWGNTKQVDAGEIGEWSRRAIFNRLGSGRLPMIEITVTDPIPWRLIDGYLTEPIVCRN